MKIIIPVAGAGTRLRPHTYTQPKPLIPLAGKTIISFIIDSFIQQGQNDFIFIIGYLGEKIKNFINDEYPDINADFITQSERGGTGHAVFLTQELIRPDEELFIIFGDTICEYPLADFITSSESVIAVKKVDDPREFGVAEVSENGYIKRVVEKPMIPKSNMAMVGIYKINESKKLFELMRSDIDQLKPEEEYSLTSALESLIASGTPVKAHSVNNWYDCGKKEILLETNAILLEKMEYPSESIPFFENSIVIHPISIGKNCNIQNSIIGPNVTIADNTQIIGSVVSDSIIGSYSEIHNVLLNESIIGSDAIIRGKNQSLNIGDNTELDLS
jgi:glucose-1-phosphate thymidylyltransferase